MGILDLFRRKGGERKRTAGAGGHRQYAAAAQSRLLADFIGSNLTADALLKMQLRTLRARSRDLERNNDYARRFLDMVSENVIGPNGIKLQMQIRNSRGVMDFAANEMIETAWREWGRVGTCTVDGRLSWADAQDMFMRGIAREGEIIVREVIGPDAGNRFGYALQFIEPDHLDEDMNRELADGRRIVMGVEKNQYDRPIAYHLRSDHPGEHAYRETYGHTVAIAADRIIHGFLSERPTQTRGVPWMTAAMIRLHQLGRYEEAELIAARIGAAKMGLITTPDGEYEGDDDEDGIPIMELEPGTFRTLAPGQGMEKFDVDHPNNGFDQFVRAMLRGVASSLGTSYHSLSGDLTQVNYSSIRQGSLAERDNWRRLQRWTVEHFCERVFRRWLEASLTMRAINLPFSRRAIFADGATFQPRGWQWIDPLKEVKAQVEAIDNGLMSRTAALAEAGRDLDETFTQLQNEAALAKAKGIELGKNASATTGNGPEAGDDGEGDSQQDD